MVLSRTTRWLLFSAAVIAFFVVAYIMVWYARGYTFDFTERRFIHTGAVTLEVNVGATITLNGEPLESASFIGNEYARDGLKPGSYTLRAERDGYSSWAKSILIEEGRVTSYPNVFLVDLSEEAASISRDTIVQRRLAVTSVSPTPTPTGTPRPPQGISQQGATLLRDGEPFATDVLEFALSDDGSRVTWWTRNEVWVMWLRSTNEPPFRTAYSAEIVTRLSLPISYVIWWPDEHHVAVVSGVEIRVIEIDARGGTNIVNLP